MKLIFLLVSFIVYAQDVPPPPNNNGPDAPGLPIDSEIWILLLAGLILGLTVVYRRYRAKDKLA